MSTAAKEKVTDIKPPKTGLALLREPFPAHHISKLPKPTKAQTEQVRNDFRLGFRCPLCNGWHHPEVVHLDYVGHAALTDRLLDVDPNWQWEPLAFDERGFPALDADGGMWIKLTVLGVTRLGYGDAQGKSGPDATKERIGDALRNAAMRFGAALDLWHKGDLHLSQDEPQPGADVQLATDEQWAELRDFVEAGAVDDAQQKWLKKHENTLTQKQAETALTRLRAA